MSDTGREMSSRSSGGRINVENKSLLNLLDDKDKNEENAPVTTVYVESPVFTKEDEDKYKFVSEEVDEFDDSQDEALRKSKERQEEALKEKLKQTKIDVPQDEDESSKEPDAVVNLTFDAEGKLVGAEQEKRTQSATSSGSAQFAIRSSAKSKNSGNKTFVKEEAGEKQADTKKKVGMKPLSREEQQDLEELQREEEYQRAEQKKIQELQNKTQGIDIPKLDLVDSEDENKGDSTDLALHEGTPRNSESKKSKPSSSETRDSLEDPQQTHNESDWSDPPENPFQHQTQSDLDTSNQRETPAGNSSQSAVGLVVGFPAKNTPPPPPLLQAPQQEGFHLQGDEDPRLQQMFAQQYAHQVAQYPHSTPQRPVANNHMQGSYGFDPNSSNGQFDSGRDRMPRSHFEPEPEPQLYEQYPGQNQQQYSGHYYVEANIGQVPQQQVGYMNQGPPQQPSPGRGYQGNQEIDMRHMPQGYYNGGSEYYEASGYAGQGNVAHPNQQQYYEPGYDRQESGYSNDGPYGFPSEADTGPYQSPHTHSAGTYQSTASSKPRGPDYIAMNKKNLKNPPKKSYRNMYGKKKDAENEPPFVPQGRRPAQTVDSPKKSNTPQKPPPNQMPVNHNQEPMTAEEFWRRRAANLENRKAEKLSGGKSRSGLSLKKYPSESRVDDIRPHRVAPIQQSPHAIAEPIKSEMTRSPRGQPVTQTVYTEDGQRVSVDINLKLVSPPAVGGPTRPDFNSYHQRPPPPQQQQYGYAQGYSHSYQQPQPPHSTYGYSGPTNQFTYRAPVHHAHPPARPVWGQNEPPQEYGSPHYEPEPQYTQSPIQSPYRVLPPIGSAEARYRHFKKREECLRKPLFRLSRELEALDRQLEEMYYQDLIAKEKSSQRDTSPRKDARDGSPRKGEEDPGSYMDQFQRSKNKKVEYKEYTLRDYRKMKKEVRLGGLGPDMDSEDVKEKKEKINRQQEYARQIKEKNRMALENSRRKAPPPRPKEDPEKENLLDRRKMVLEYARSVPRPKVASHSAGSKAGSVQSPSATTPGGLNDNDAEMMELQRLAERHAREREQTDAIRQNIESAVSAR